MTNEKQNSEIEIPFDQIKNPTIINRAKTNPQILPKLIEYTATKLNAPPGIAKALIFGNLHTGGTASKASPNHTFNLTHNNKIFSLDLQTLRSLTEKTIITEGEKFTLRQLARTHEQDILTFASKFNITGNLGKKLLQMDPTLEPEQLIYAADYVEPTNPSIPKQIQNLLMSHKNETTK
uniref:Uncharacterized protein n=1 Tax=Caulerpa verticillata TaxID=177082 RepID=A0A386B095_9CHLO|nr:hypothetical protein [Caulerpa verticillata]AYC65114.1 hypothetical protein [Caulerpa verticillata]